MSITPTCPPDCPECHGLGSVATGTWTEGSLGRRPCETGLRRPGELLHVPTPPPSEVEALADVVEANDRGSSGHMTMRERRDMASAILSAGYLPPSRVEALRREIEEAEKRAGRANKTAIRRESDNSPYLDQKALRADGEVAGLRRALSIIEGKP